jgi:hypothetical protein
MFKKAKSKLKEKIKAAAPYAVGAVLGIAAVTIGYTLGGCSDD